MAKKNSVTMKIKSALESLEDRVVHKGGTKINVTKKDKSQSKKKLKISNHSRKQNRRK